MNIEKTKVLKSDVRAGELYDFAAENPEGFRLWEFAEESECTMGQASDAVSRLRKMLGDHEINLICDPEGWGPWIYRLVETPQDARPWLLTRQGDTISRIKIQLEVARSGVNATDGRTIEGRYARKEVKAYLRQIEDFEEMHEEILERDRLEAEAEKKKIEA